MDSLIEATSDPTKGEALFHAIEQGKIRVISNIIESGYDINVRNESMRTPLMQAVFVSKDDVRTYIVRLVLGKGCDVNAQDEDGRTVLMLAAFEPNRDDVVRRVVATGKCDPNLKDFKGNTALIHAVHGGNASVIRILVNSSHTKGIIKVNYSNNDGINPLKLAYKLRQEECCRVLVEEGGADTSVIKDREGFKYFLHRNDPKVPENVPLVVEGHGTRKVTGPFMDLIASTSGNGMSTDIGLDLRERKKTKRLRKKRSKKQMEQQESEVDTVLDLNLFSPTQSTPRSNITFTMNPSMSRSNTLMIPNDNRVDSLTPHSHYSNNSRNRRLTPISALFAPSTPFNPRTPKSLATPDKTSHAAWWSTSDEYDQMSPMDQLFQERDKKSKVKRKKKPKARLSPLHSDYLTSGSMVNDSGPTQRGTLLPAIPTTGRKVNLVGTPRFYKDMDYQFGE